MKLFSWWFAVFALLMLPLFAHAAAIHVIVDTSALSGAPVALAFDLIDGGPPANNVSVSSFSTDGTLGTASSSGDVIGTFPGTVTLSDSSFFSEYLQNLMLGNTLGFNFNTTGNTADPISIPDAFSFFLLNSSATLSLVTSSDPTGADALFLFSIGEPGALQVYTADGVSVRLAPGGQVPNPNTLILALTGIAIFVTVNSILRSRRLKRSFVVTHSNNTVG